MADSFKDRLLDMIQNSEKIEILDTDHTSVLFVVTIKDRRGTRHHKGVFYPKEWSIHGKEHDDFELECEEYVEPKRSET